jgi:putative glutamine amidotransferase
MSEVDGLLLPGSDSDVDPARYGQEPHPHLGFVVNEKDETDLLTLEEGERRGIPVFAICFGIQSLNVFRGGTLIQDIPSQLPNAIKHEQGKPRNRHSHRVRILDGSLLRQLANTDNAPVNSFHHQAIGNFGKGTGRHRLGVGWSG